MNKTEAMQDMILGKKFRVFNGTEAVHYDIKFDGSNFVNLNGHKVNMSTFKENDRFILIEREINLGAQRITEAWEAILNSPTTYVSPIPSRVTLAELLRELGFNK